MTTPENIRAAAYLATRERLDFRRTQKVKCKPPNRQCGNRCIPPNWDCRLKGEGNDGHLRAVGKGSDPISGFANIERGITRIRKGATKLSISEIEGGRKAIARGTAKLAPADMKQKQEIKEKTDFFLGKVLLPLAAVVGVAYFHKGLKSFRGYREGVGAQIDESARSAINTVRRNVPVYGNLVRERQQIGGEAVKGIAATRQFIRSTGPEGWSSPGQRGYLTGITQNQRRFYGEGSDLEVTALLDKSLATADFKTPRSKTPSQKDYIPWSNDSLVSFWSTRRSIDVTPTGINRDGSLFSVHATNTLLAKSFGLNPPAGTNLKAEGDEIIQNVRKVFRQTGDGIRKSMKEFGLDSKDPEAIRKFIDRSRATNELDEKANALLVDTVINTNYDTQAKRFYSDVLKKYDDRFEQVVDNIRQAPSIDVVRGSTRGREQLRALRENSYYNDAVLAHSQALGAAIELPAPVYGTYTGVLAKRAYHVRRVAGKRILGNNAEVSVFLSRTEALNAGAEVARATGVREPETVDAALELVRNHYGQGSGGIGYINLVEGSTPRAATRPQATGQVRAARRRTPNRGEIIARLLKQKRRRRNPDGSWGEYEPAYTPESAAAEADRLLAFRKQRNRQDARVEAYLAVRADFVPPNERLGKPCGKSFIKKNQKCSKPTTARYAQAPQAQAIKPKSKDKESTLEKAGKAALTAGAVAALAVGARKGYRNRAKIKETGQRIGKEVQRFSRMSPRLKKKYVKAKLNRLATTAQRTSSLVPFAGIRALSNDNVIKGLGKLPKDMQPKAKKLVGDAKKAAAYLQLRGQGYKPSVIDIENNYSMWKNKDGDVRIVSSVDDLLINFNVKKVRKGNIFKDANLPTYNVDFLVDQSFEQRKNVESKQGMKVIRNLKSMFERSMAELPDEAILINSPYRGKDNKGESRANVYTKYGFNDYEDARDTETGESAIQWAYLKNGKVERMTKEEADSRIEDLLDPIDEDEFDIDPDVDEDAGFEDSSAMEPAPTAAPRRRIQAQRRKNVVYKRDAVWAWGFNVEYSEQIPLTAQAA